jgi:hypothetical protein
MRHPKFEEDSTFVEVPEVEILIRIF